MERKLYVGNLAFTTTEDNLIDQFSRFGSVDSVKIIVDRLSNQSKGFAFVEMATSHEASSAIEGLNDFDLNGRKMVVNEAKPQKPRERFSRY